MLGPIGRKARKPKCGLDPTYSPDGDTLGDPQKFKVRGRMVERTSVLTSKWWERPKKGVEESSGLARGREQ